MQIQQMLIKNNILECIGNTPLVRLNRIAKEVECEVVVKCEFLNPGGSVKDRPARHMVENAHLEGNAVLIEPSSGNMGIGLALAGAVHAIPVHITMPDKMSSEKIAVLNALGAKVHLTPEEAEHDDPRSHLALANDLVKGRAGGTMLNQYTNPNNPESHEVTTAVEILRDTEGQVDAIVAGAGTGGTVTGIARHFKKVNHAALIIGIDPVGSILADPERNSIVPYAVEGIGYDFVPPVLQRSLVDHWESVSDAEAFSMARRLIREEGLLVGGSCGAAVSGALKAIKRRPELNVRGKRVVVILPDSIRNYLSKFVSDAWLLCKGFKQPQGPSVPIKDEFLKGPIRVVSREQARQASQEFPLLVKSNSNDSKIVGVLTAPAALRAAISGADAVLEKNFIIIPITSNMHPDLVATGYGIFVCKDASNYYELDVNAFVSHYISRKS